MKNIDVCFKKNNKGFTLIELLAVIVILSILLSISVVSVNNIRRKQEAENRKNVISSILTGAKRYVADYPEKLDSLPTTPATIDVSELLKNEKYVDFDQNKYSNLKTSVSVSMCTNPIKLKYSFTDPADNKNYNDCGCDEQPIVSDEDANKLCTE